MGDFIYFTGEQKERANAVSIYDILRERGEPVERAGREWRWKRHNSITFRGNQWYRHSTREGGKAISFMQGFFDMSYPEAVTYLLHGETGEIIHGRRHIPLGERKQYEKGKEEQQVEEPQKKELQIPPKHENMKRVYAYLMQKRHISRDIISFFAKLGTLYEDAEHHNIVFAGVDKEGIIRHVHKKSTNSEGRNFRINEDGSDTAYGFGYMGAGNKLYVFEAPIDMLSFLTLYPKDWQKESYIVLNGVAEHPMLKALEAHSNLDTVVLCLDYDPAGIEACDRLSEILVSKGYRKVQRLLPECKDWNEDLRKLNGEEAIPGKEHPKLLECAAWMESLKKVTEDMNGNYATRDAMCRYYNNIRETLKEGKGLEQLEEAFDGYGLLLSAAMVRFMEQLGKELLRETSAGDILINIQKRYKPHKDKGNLNTHIRGMESAFKEFMETYGAEKAVSAKQKEILVKKAMSLTMECIKAHIFLETEYKKELQEKEMKMPCSQL